jgi:hypothetical protein
MNKQNHSDCFRHFNKIIWLIDLQNTNLSEEDHFMVKYDIVSNFIFYNSSKRKNNIIIIKRRKYI